MPAKTAAKPSSKCRGTWSVCGGKFQQKSESWHICDSCTKKRAQAMKTAKAGALTNGKAKAATTKIAGPESGAGRAPRPPRRPIARVPVAKAQPAVAQLVAPPK